MRLTDIRSFLRARTLDFLGLISKPAVGVHILNGHKISNDRDNGSENSRKRFDALLCKLEEHCRLINFEEAVKLIEDHVQVKYPLVAFTFDDGFDDCYYSIAPVLEKHDVNAMFFINPNAVSAAENHDENYIKKFADVTTVSPGKVPMNWGQLKDLKARGFLIGAHTMDHYMMNHGSMSDLTYQINACKKEIESRIGGICDSFAWPYGQMGHVNMPAVELALETYRYVYSQTNYKRYFSCDGRVINRRHFEPFWPYRHLKFFLSCKKK